MAIVRDQPDCSGGNRQAKHLLLKEAIDNLWNLRDQAEKLLEEITPPRPQKGTDECVEKERIPSLSEVLDNGPSWIQDVNLQISEILSQIRQAIL